MLHILFVILDMSADTCSQVCTHMCPMFYSGVFGSISALGAYQPCYPIMACNCRLAAHLSHSQSSSAGAAAAEELPTMLSCMAPCMQSLSGIMLQLSWRCHFTLGIPCVDPTAGLFNIVRDKGHHQPPPCRYLCHYLQVQTLQCRQMPTASCWDHPQLQRNCIHINRPNLLLPQGAAVDGKCLLVWDEHSRHLPACIPYGVACDLLELQAPLRTSTNAHETP